MHFPALVFVVAITVITTTAAADEKLLLPGGWDLSIKKDLMSDKTQARVFKLQDGNAIGLKCDEAGPQSLYFQIISKDFLGKQIRSASRPMMVRFDQDSPVTVNMYTDARSAFVFDATAAASMARKSALAKTVAFRIFDFDGDSHDMSFDLTGAADAFAKVSIACQQPL
jgi:hypothetical protein